MDASITQEIPSLKITNIRRRRDGRFLIESNGEVVMSLTERQMAMVLAVANEKCGDEVRSGLRDVVFHNRARMKLKHPARRQGKLVSEIPVPLTPSERAILCRTLRRIESLGLLEVNYGSQDIEATEVGLAIADWIDEHIEILGQDEYLLEWVKEEEG